MLRQHFGLRLHRRGELRLQHLGNLLVDLLPRALQERLIRRLLGQHMLKGIGPVGCRTRFVQELGMVKVLEVPATALPQAAR